jgi:phasin family protein
MQTFATSPALRSHLEHQVNFFTELSHKSYDTLRRLSELNLRLAQQLVEDSVDTGRDLMNAMHPFQYGPIALRHAEPVAQHLRSYQQALFGVLAGAQSGLAQTARERMPEAGRSAAAAAEEFARRGADAADAFSTRH